jgi:hypothetical protein
MEPRRATLEIHEIVVFFSTRSAFRCAIIYLFYDS